MLPKEAIEEYKGLYKVRYGVVLSDTEASFRANNLVNLYKVTLGSKPFEIRSAGENNPPNI